MRSDNESFQVSKCFKIAVEAAAGAVFLPIIKLQSWVRRDGLSLDFHAGEPPTSRMWPHWARGVYVVVYYDTSCFRYSY